MSGSDITCSGLVAIDDVAGIKLEWVVNDPWPPSMHYSTEFVEAWAATVNDRDHASFQKIGQGQTNFSYAGLQRGESRFFWVRARNKIYNTVGGVKTWSGSYGAWFPESATAGVQGTELSGDVLIATNGYWKHPSGLIEQWGEAVTDAAGAVIVDYPIEFPNAVFNVIATIAGFNVPDRTISLAATVNTFFQATINDAAQVGKANTFYWQARGY